MGKHPFLDPEYDAALVALDGPLLVANEAHTMDAATGLPVFGERPGFLLCPQLPGDRLCVSAHRNGGPLSWPEPFHSSTASALWQARPAPGSTGIARRCHCAPGHLAAVAVATLRQSVFVRACINVVLHSNVGDCPCCKHWPRTHTQCHTEPRWCARSLYNAAECLALAARAEWCVIHLGVRCRSADPACRASLVFPGSGRADGGRRCDCAPTLRSRVGKSPRPAGAWCSDPHYHPPAVYRSHMGSAALLRDPLLRRA